MPITVPPAIAKRLTELEVARRPIDFYSLADELSKLINPEKLTEAEQLGYQAERVGWLFMPIGGDNTSPWGCYFQPLTSFITNDSENVYFPDAKKIPREVIEYWQTRVEQSPHPVLRARYVDLVLEIGRIWNLHHSREPKLKFSIELSRQGIDAHQQAITDSLAESDAQAWTFLDRALDLALNIKDQKRIKQVKRVAFDYCQHQRKKDQSGYWWRLSNMLLGHRGVSLTNTEHYELIGWLQEALNIHADINDAQYFDPHQAQDAADHLLRWLKNSGEPERIAIIKKAGTAFEMIAEKSDALTAIGWLENLSMRYRQENLMNDVARVEMMIKACGSEAEQVMVCHEIKQTIPKEQIDEWLDALLDKSLEPSLGRVAVWFISSEKQLQQLVEDSAANAPLQADMAIHFLYSTGFPRAKIGSVKDDMPGRIINMAAMVIGFRAPFLCSALDQVKERWQFSSDKLFAWLTRSPVFSIGSHELLRVGIDAWFAEDHIKAIHLLVPRVEAALREWLVMMGESPRQPSHLKTGGVEVISMGATLYKEAFKTKVDPSLRLHLRALYIEAKGLNLRNQIAHGLARPETLNRQVSYWVVHSLIAICAYTQLKK